MKILSSLSLIACTAACHAGGSALTAGNALPWEIRAESWRTDSAWYDGTAEACVYRATRTIYGKQREYLAYAYTNKQAMDPKTTTKSSGPEGTEVFKHHWSERIETEKYDYDFSTASFTTCDALNPFKLTAATQEDCGASFKQVWREGERVRSLESVYFPDAGLRMGQVEQANFVFGDALPLVLRDFPFGSKESRELWVLPSQKSTKRVPFAPELRRVVPRGEVSLELPLGTQLAQRLDLVDPESEATLASYWFASQSAAPWMHVLLKYEGPMGVSYTLESHARTAYWER